MNRKMPFEDPSADVLDLLAALRMSLKRAPRRQLSSSLTSKPHRPRDRKEVDSQNLQQIREAAEKKGRT